METTGISLKSLVKRYKVGNVQPAMQRGQGRYIFVASFGVVQVVNMKVDQVEVVLFLEHALHQQHMVRQRVDAVG